MANETILDVQAKILQADSDYFKVPWVYEFSNARKFYDDDTEEDSGIYENP
jgi:hypothetical protein